MAFDPLAPFTGDPQVQATKDIQANLAQKEQLGLNTAQTNLTGGLAALKSGTTQGVNAIGAGTTGAQNYLTPAISGAVGSLYGGQNLGFNALTGAAPLATGAIQGGTQEAIDAYRQLLANTGSGNPQTSQALADSLGLNGPAGTARAQAAFQGGPGFQFALGQGLEGLTRAANTSGMAAGGNAFRQAGDYATNLALQGWQQYVNDLQAKMNQEAQSGAAGAAGIAGAATGGGANLANVYTGTGAKLSDLFSGTGQQVANTMLGGGTSLADLTQRGGLAAGSLYGTGGANAANLYGTNTGQVLGLIQAGYAPYANAADAAAQAQEQGPLNLYNLAINAGKMAAGFPSFGGGGGGGTPMTQYEGNVWTPANPYNSPA